MNDIDLTEAQQSGFLAVEDLLIEFRDSRISIFPYANGVVVNEKDGSPSPMVRMRTRHATDLAIETAAPLIEAQVREQAVAALEQVASDRSYDPAERKAYLDAARIVARGESS